MSGEPDHIQVLAFYANVCRPKQIRALGSAGGFSGARFWRIETDSGIFCLRRWPPEHPTQEGLEFIQAVLWYVAREGFNLVPLPLENCRQGGYVRHAGHFWELAPWMPGVASFRAEPSAAKLRAAMTALGEFHQAAATFPLPNPSPGPSPGITSRLRQLRAWLSGDLARLSETIRPGLWPEMETRAGEILRLVAPTAGDVLERLTRSARSMVALQPCIRDIWHDHVLYQGDMVSGLIDFGSMQPDSPATDVARLLGSMAEDDADLWTTGLEAYQSRRAMSAAETSLVDTFDRSTVLMAGLNWIDWVFRRGRRFERPEAVLERVDAILARLRRLAARR